MVMAWLIVTALAMIAGAWAWLNLSPTRRDNLRHRLEPEDLDRLPADRPLPKVAILCPGRNEAHWIRTTLPELCRQEGVDYRVVYIDDHSDDDTPAVTAACAGEFKHLLVVRNTTEPPAGWVGKPWAVRQGYEALKQAEARETSGAPGGGEPATWLCFTDADIHWHPRCLATALRHAQQHEAGLVALFPGMEFGTVAEKLGVSTMVLALGILFPFDHAMDPSNPRTLTGGAFMLTRRDLYDQIGGHQAVANRMVEDIQLGMALKAAGAKVRIACTAALLHCRMYEGWRDMWEGLTKNAYAGMDYNPLMAAGFVVGSLLVNVLPPAYLAGSALWWWSGGSWLAALATLLSVAILLLQARAMNAVRKLMKLSWPYAWAVPPGTGMYCLFILGSVWRYYRGGNVWKGRSYDAGRLQAAKP
jgi:cellulose synthase/poly-beta-1,6-N-acetylglucosamine synthase-like glycosyltransferase